MTKVIVAEDYDSMREMWGIFLTRRGIEVTLCENGEQVLEEIAKNSHYDGLITDDRMGPGITGSDLTRILRQKLGDKFPICLVSGTLSDKEAKEAGATYYFRKPVMMEQIDEIANYLKPSHEDGKSDSEQQYSGD